MMSRDKCKKVTILAATFSGNKGASSMLETIVDHITQTDKEVSFDILSVYPKEDRKQNPYSHCTIISPTPKAMVFWAFPLALLLPIFGRWPFVISFLSRFFPILASLSRSDLGLNNSKKTGDWGSFYSISKIDIKIKPYLNIEKLTNRIALL